MRSLRARILAYHLLSGLALSAVASSMAVFLLVQILAHNMNQTLSDAARGLPDIVAYYTARDGSLDRATPAIVGHFATEGITALIIPPGRLQSLPPLPAALRTAPPFRPPMLLMAGTPPISVDVPGGAVVLRIDSQRLGVIDGYIAALVASIFLIVVSTSAVVGVGTVRRALEPLNRTTAALTRLGDGDFHVEDVGTQDASELGQLARAYNRAVAAVHKAFDERDRTQSEMQQFVADAGHQLRTPLTVIMGHLSALTLQGIDRPSGAALENMLTESRRMRGLIEDLILLTRLEETSDTTGAIDLRAFVIEFANAHRSGGLAEIRLGTLEKGFVPARESDIHSALSALIDNAKKYAPDSPVEIDLKRLGSALELRVMDRGPGMTEGDLAHALDRFYRGRGGAKVSGSGLGLAIIRRIMQRAGGSIVLHNRPLGGLECVLCFPLVAEPGPARNSDEAKVQVA